MTFHQGVMMMRMECERCEGTGQMIGAPCTACAGKGSETVKTQQEIKFPRGVENNATLKFKGKGHSNGDLVVQVAVKPHPRFRREGYDAVCEQEVSAIDAVLGTECEVGTIYGETRRVKIPAGTQHGDKIRLQKEGFWRLNSQEKGNQVLVLRVKIPEKVSKQERELYLKLKEFEK